LSIIKIFSYKNISLLEQNIVNPLPYSPDLSAIELIWSIEKMQPTNLEELKKPIRKA